MSYIFHEGPILQVRRKTNIYTYLYTRYGSTTSDYKYCNTYNIDSADGVDKRTNKRRCARNVFVARTFQLISYPHRLARNVLKTVDFLFYGLRTSRSKNENIDYFIAKSGPIRFPNRLPTVVPCTISAVRFLIRFKE